MATNALPNNIGDLLKLANKMVAGLKALGQPLNITQTTALTLQAQINVFTTAQSLFNAARVARQLAGKACTDFHKDIELWLTRARDVLVPYLGRSWSVEWVSAGFSDHSTAVPRSVGDQLKLLGLMAAFFADHPNYEDPEVGITEAAATALQANSLGADATFNVRKTAASEQKGGRTTALAELQSGMRMLIGILDQLLGADDPRWETFGLNRPEADVTPAAPENLTVNFADGPVLLTACGAVPLATRYRWRMRLVDLEEDFRLAASTKSPLAQIEKVLPGQTVELIVQAANASAQSLPSESVVVTLPTVAERMPAVKVVANGSGETVSGYTSLEAPAVEGNGAARSARKPEPNGARH